MDKSGEVMIFLGTYNHVIDEKNRINLPAKIASKFNSSLVINKGLDGCLELRTKSDFEIRVNALMQLSQSKKNSRIIIRQFLANSSELDIDKSCRILIPNNLKQEAGLNKDVILIGLGNKMELWDKNKYEKFKAETDLHFEEISERLDNER